MTTRSYKKWSEKEKRSLFLLLQKNNYNFRKTAKEHAKKSGRTANSIGKMLSYYKKNGSIPEYDGQNAQRLWTKKEIKLLLRLVETYPYNLAQAYRICAEKTDRTPKAVGKFFSEYRKKEEAKPHLKIIGRRKCGSVNRKNIHLKTGGTIEPMPKSIFERILSLISSL